MVRRSHIARMEPARTIIEICGGVAAVADMTGRSEGRVRRWTFSKERGGTGGIIPAESQIALFNEACKRGIDLRPDHFFSAEPISVAPPQTPEDAA